MGTLAATRKATVALLEPAPPWDVRNNPKHAPATKFIGLRTYNDKLERTPGPTLPYFMQGAHQSAVHVRTLVFEPPSNGLGFTLRSKLLASATASFCPHELARQFNRARLHRSHAFAEVALHFFGHAGHAIEHGAMLAPSRSDSTPDKSEQLCASCV